MTVRSVGFRCRSSSRCSRCRQSLQRRAARLRSRPHAVLRVAPSDFLRCRPPAVVSCCCSSLVCSFSGIMSVFSFDPTKLQFFLKHPTMLRFFSERFKKTWYDLGGDVSSRRTYRQCDVRTRRLLQVLNRCQLAFDWNARAYIRICLTMATRPFERVGERCSVSPMRSMK